MFTVFKKLPQVCLTWAQAGSLRAIGHCLNVWYVIGSSGALRCLLSPGVMLYKLISLQLPPPTKFEGSVSPGTQVQARSWTSE